MMDHETVCCMCGDVGFSDKLFRCNKCLNRFQHSYCSSFYKENQSTETEVCDWCESEGRRVSESVRAGGGSSKRPNPSENSSTVGKIKRQDGRESHTIVTADKGKNGGSPSPRTPTRRYKLLKDVM